MDSQSAGINWQDWRRKPFLGWGVASRRAIGRCPRGLCGTKLEIGVKSCSAYER
jgi:hypothetical protein